MSKFCRSANQNQVILPSIEGKLRKNALCLNQSAFSNFALYVISVSYAEGTLTCKFELNMAILDFDRFEVSKNPIFHNSSRRPEMVRFILVTLKVA